MFRVETDRANRIIYLSMGGVLSIDEAHACAGAKEAAVESLGAPYDHSTLLDIRDLRLQPQEVFGIFTHFVATTKHKSRRIAIVAGDGTARMQFRRVAERAPLRNDMRFFTGFKEARAWLVEDARAPDQPPPAGRPQPAARPTQAR